LLRLLFQDATETLEDRHPPLEQLVIILRGGGQALDREIRTGGLLASERAIVQVGFVTSASACASVMIVTPAVKRYTPAKLQGRRRGDAARKDDRAYPDP